MAAPLGWISLWEETTGGSCSEESEKGMGMMLATPYPQYLLGNSILQ